MSSIKSRVDPALHLPSPASSSYAERSAQPRLWQSASLLPRNQPPGCLPPVVHGKVVVTGDGGVLQRRQGTISPLQVLHVCAAGGEGAEWWQARLCPAFLVSRRAAALHTAHCTPLHTTALYCARATHPTSHAPAARLRRPPMPGHRVSAPPPATHDGRL
jgi:hypothetical protein